MEDNSMGPAEEAEARAFVMVQVPASGLHVFDPDTYEDGLKRSGLSGQKILPCFIIQGRSDKAAFLHYYAAALPDGEEEPSVGDRVTLPLNFDVQWGALVVNHATDGFVRAYGPGCWERVRRADEKSFLDDEDDMNKEGDGPA